MTFFGLRAFGLLWVVMICSGAIFAFASIPNRADRWVNDAARIIAASDETKIRTVLKNTQATTGDEITVVTIDSQNGFSSAAESWERFATRWFNTWRIGNSNTNRGVLILVAVKDRRVRVELGKGFSRAYDKVMKCVIDSSMIPKFKQDNYSAGILNGTNAVIRAIRTKNAPCPGVSFVQPVPSRPQVQSYTPVQPRVLGDTQPVTGPVLRDLNVSKPKPVTLGLEWLLGGCGVLILGSILPSLFRPRVRKCPQCAQPMHKLDEQSDDEYLFDGQKLEEVLHSVNYVVWRCSSCRQGQVVRHSRWFSGYDNCPSCSRKTLFSDRQILVAPSHHHSGQDRVVRDCKHCDFRDSHVVITPRLETRRSSDSLRSSSSGSSGGDSSGGSSSGGSSSGGGASGSW